MDDIVNGEVTAIPGEQAFADVGWYDAREAGLGKRFTNAVRDAVDAEAWPTWARWHLNIRPSRNVVPLSPNAIHVSTVTDATPLTPQPRLVRFALSP